MPKKIISFILVAVVISLLSLLYFRKQLLNPAFNLIDDGYTQYISQELNRDVSLKNWRQTLIDRELEKGRLRPGYYLYYYGVSLFSQDNPEGFWAAQTVSLMAILFVMYWFFRKAEIPYWLSLLFIMPVFLLPSISENFLRLGPAEPRQLLWLMLSAYFLWATFQNKKQHLFSYLLSILFFALALTTKETTLIALPAFLYELAASQLQSGKTFSIKSFSKTHLLLALAMLIGTVAFAAVLPMSGYSSELSLSLAQAKANLFSLRVSFPEPHWVLALGTISLGLRAIYQKNLKFIFKKEFSLSLFFLLLALPFMTLPLFWPYQLERYYLPGQFFTWIFFITEGWLIFQLLRKKTEDAGVRIVILFFILAAAVTSIVFLPGLLNPENLISRLIESKKNWYEQYQYSDALITYLKNEVPENTKLVVTHNDYEVIYEIGLYASQMLTKNVKVYSENTDATQAFGEPHAYTEDAAALFTGLESPAVLIGRGTATEIYPSAQVLYPEDSQLANKDLSWFVVIK